MYLYILATGRARTRKESKQGIFFRGRKEFFKKSVFNNLLILILQQVTTVTIGLPRKNKNKQMIFFSRLLK